MPELTWRLQHWPLDTPENWQQVGEPVEADTWEQAVEKIGPTEAGRYLIMNDASLDHGQYFRLEPDKTMVPVDAF